MSNLMQFGVYFFDLLSYIIIIFMVLRGSEISKIFNKNKMVIFSFLFLIPYCLYLYGKVTHFVFGWKTGSTDGWLGFLGAYYGAMIAIGGIYWQVNKDSENVKKNSLDVSIALKNLDEYVSISRKISRLSIEIKYHYKQPYLDDSSPDTDNWEVKDDFGDKLETTIDEQFDNFIILNSIYGHDCSEDEKILKQNFSNIKQSYKNFAGYVFDLTENGMIATENSNFDWDPKMVSDVDKSREKLIDEINNAAIFINKFANRQIDK